MAVETLDVCTVDAEGRLTLPKQFAGASVLVEAIGANELRIRNVTAVPDDELPFAEELVIRLSRRDSEKFLALLENPPEPTPALKEAVARYRKRHG